VQVQVAGLAPVEGSGKGGVAFVALQRAIGSGVIVDRDGYIMNMRMLWKGHSGSAGNIFARLAEVMPAAKIIAPSRKMLVQRGPRSRRTSTKPTAMIWTSPRTSATAVSRSR
jgi:hypothetical protein